MEYLNENPIIQNLSIGSKENDHPEGPVMSDDPDAYSWEPKPPEPVKCPYCGNNQYYAGYYFGGGKAQWYTNTKDAPVPCKCDGMTKHLQDEHDALMRAIEKREQEQRQKELEWQIEVNKRNCGMPAKYKHRTFDSFKETAENNYPFRVAKAYAERFEEISAKEKNGLYISGPVGTGKTHMVASIANELLNTGVKVICMTSVDMLAKIRATFKTESGNDDEVIREFKTADLLIIDDLGKEKATEWSAQTIYAIINARYENELPTIITTNYDRDELVDRLAPTGSPDKITACATVDRINEVCIPLKTAGPSWRRKD